VEMQSKKIMTSKFTIWLLCNAIQFDWVECTPALG